MKVWVKDIITLNMDQKRELQILSKKVDELAKKIEPEDSLFNLEKITTMAEFLIAEDNLKDPVNYKIQVTIFDL